MKIDSDFKPSKEAIENYLRGYIAEYRRFLEENFPERKNDFPLYSRYPYHVTVYINNRGIEIEYQPDVEELTIEVKFARTERRPKKRGVILWGSMANWYIERVIDKPEAMARRDIQQWIDHEKFQLEQAEYYEREYQKYVEELVDTAIEGFVSYIGRSKKVKEKTLSDNKNEVFHVISIVRSEPSLLGVFAKSDCDALFNVTDQMIEDIETSLFMVLHGKYRPALALLRRYLETNLVALYFDSEIRKHNKRTKTYEDLVSKRGRWLQKPRHWRLSGEYGIFERLIDPDTNHVALEAMKGSSKHFSRSSFREYVEDIYHGLSKLVHFSGARSLDDLSLEFSEYDKDLFNEWYTRLLQVQEMCNLLLAIKIPKVLGLYEQAQKKIAPAERVPLLIDRQIHVLLRQLAETQK